MAPCAVLIRSQGSADRHHQCTGSSCCCWSRWHVLLGCSSTLHYQASSPIVASNQYSYLSSGFFFFNKALKSAMHVRKTAESISALWQLLCFITQTLNHDWPVGSWQTIFCWTVTTATGPNPSAGSLFMRFWFFSTREVIWFLCCVQRAGIGFAFNYLTCLAGNTCVDGRRHRKTKLLLWNQRSGTE